MTSMPVDWHERFLASMLMGLLEEERMLTHRQARIDRLRRETKFYAAQIEAARAEGRRKFDAGRYRRTPPRSADSEDQL